VLDSEALDRWSKAERHAREAARRMIRRMFLSSGWPIEKVDGLFPER
jgi:hypothetical protein